MQNKIKNRKTKCHIRTCSGYPGKWIPAINARMTQYQQGRSMVEMLGVLAVIGVLSVAGIAGYSVAMQSYRTNEILNATSMFYVLAMSQNQGNGPSGKIDYSNVGGTNPSGATLEYENNVITITFNDAKDCTSAKNKLGDKATDDCANKKLTVTFGEASESEQEYEGEAECEESYCFSCGLWGASIDAGKDKCFDTEAHAIAYCNAIGFTDIYHDDGRISCGRPLANAWCRSSNKYVCLENNGLSKVYRCVDIDPDEMGDYHWIEQSTCSSKCQEVGMVSSSSDLCK